MRIPKESLEDFMTGMPVEPQPAEPPPDLRPLRFSGEIEVLKPIAFSEELVKRPVETLVPLVPSPPPVVKTHWFSGFYRSLAVAGSLAVITLVLASGIFFGVYRPTAEPVTSPSDVGLDQQPEGILITPDNPDLTGHTTPTDSPLASDRPGAVPSVTRAVRPVRRSSATGPLRTYYRARHAVRPNPIVMTDFVPTTLVIYAENGQIKTRIEPQLTSSYKKPLSLPN